jgi:hypothetical protein
METKSRSELISAERELDKATGLVDQQYELVKRLQRLGVDTKEAIRLLIDLLELQQSREQQLSYLRMRGTDRGSGRFKNKQLEDDMAFEQHRDKNERVGS